ncbi:MAG: GDSL-type esterase/lipase family protein [Planctomycetota bacterium]
MQSVLGLGLILLMLGPSQAEPAKPIEDALFEEKSVTVGERSFGYRLLAPERIEEGRQYPVVLFLHGAGERGDDNRAQLAYLPKKLAGLREEYPCFVVAPQCPREGWWVTRERPEPLWESPSTTPAMEGAMEALRVTLREHPVDLDRIYLTGLSMGGYGSWDLAMRWPDVFAAVVPICGGGDPERVHRVTSVPIAVYHGADDKVVPPEFSRRLVKRLQSLGATTNYDEMAGVGHNSWTPAYRKEAALDWMFSQERGGNPTSGVLALVGKESPLRMGERIVFLGDSITQAAINPGGYVQLIDASIEKQRADRHATLIGAGISGNRVPDLQARLDADVIAHGPTVVFIYIGINDVWHSQNGRGTSKEAYESGLRDVIARLKESASSPRIVLATPTVIGEQKRGTNPLDAMLDEYAALSRQVARDTGVHVCDLREASVEYLSVRNPEDRDRGVLTTDGVHLNAEGNRFVASHAARAIFEVLERR